MWAAPLPLLPALRTATAAPSAASTSSVPPRPTPRPTPRMRFFWSSTASRVAWVSARRSAAPLVPAPASAPSREAELGCVNRRMTRLLAFCGLRLEKPKDTTSHTGSPATSGACSSVRPLPRSTGVTCAACAALMSWKPSFMPRWMSSLWPCDSSWSCVWPDSILRPPAVAAGAVALAAGPSVQSLRPTAVWYLRSWLREMGMGVVSTCHSRPSVQGGVVRLPS
mmetsp:Transcript_24601/g.62498  ORF Transcript_24601/g.62498 Transcript_24601/m.62498 type:complete len:224 (-) Transcript_24601:788-1459(-)